MWEIRSRTGTADTGRVLLMRQIVLGDNLQGLLEHFPQLNCLVVGREQEMRSILSAAPFDLVDLFFNFERLEVVEFGFVGLELGMKFVFTCFFLPEVTISIRSKLIEKSIEARHDEYLPSHSSQTAPLVHLCRRLRDSFRCGRIPQSILYRL